MYTCSVCLLQNVYDCIQVSIKFPGPVTVLHVSSFLSGGSHATLALCSASNGVISALSIQSALS